MKHPFVRAPWRDAFISKRRHPTQHGKWLISKVTSEPHRAAPRCAGRKRGQQNRLVINRRLSVFGRRRDDDYRRGGTERFSSIRAWHLVASVHVPREHTSYVMCMSRDGGPRTHSRRLKVNWRAWVLRFKYQPHGREASRQEVHENIQRSKKDKLRRLEIVFQKYVYFNVEIIISLKYVFISACITLVFCVNVLSVLFNAI